MKEHNSMELGEFVKYNLFWIVCWSICYWSWLFRSLPGQSAAFSGLLLGTLVLGCSLWGFARQWEHRRNTLSIWSNLAAACGIYTAMSYLSVRPVLIRRALVVTVTAAVVRAALVQLRPIHARTAARRRYLYRRRSQRAVTALYSTMALGLGGLMCLLLVLSLRDGGGLMTASVRPTNARQTGEQTMEAHMEQLQLLEQNRWQTLTIPQRLDVLQTVANVEQSALGLPHPLYVVTDDMEETLSGYYNDESARIVVSMQDMQERSGGYLLKTVCHESYHAYEYYLVDCYTAASPEERTQAVYASAQDYMQELENYIDSRDDPEEYYRQTCEADARSYAEQRWEEYAGQLRCSLHRQAA